MAFNKFTITPGQVKHIENRIKRRQVREAGSTRARRSDREENRKEDIKDRIAEALGTSSKSRSSLNTSVNPFSMPSGGMSLPSVAGPAQSTAAGRTGDPDLDWLISKESSGRTNAKNPKSSAFGLGQLLSANRNAYGKKLGYNPNTTDYNQQLAMMQEYIKDRYGSSSAARKFWEQKGWY